MRKYFIQDANGLVVKQCNEWNLELEKRKLVPGRYYVNGPSCDYWFTK